MNSIIKNIKFEIAHEAFKRHLLEESNGIPFVNFKHQFLVKYEIAYKWSVYHNASACLNYEKWNLWRRSPGKIIDAVKHACRESENLLDHKYGPNNYSESALYKISGSHHIQEMERILYDFFNTGENNADEFGNVFDELAIFLRENKLGCKWDFIAYLAFLASPEQYFPIKSTYFDILLDFYETGRKISGNVSWENYNILLELADELRYLLMPYGIADTVEIQSYMWVISYLIKDGKVSSKLASVPPNFNEALLARSLRAQERERIGIAGEKYIYEVEKQKLLSGGKISLAENIRLLSVNYDQTIGYDILSFNSNGSELHIEVKTTTRTRGNDDGFWLTQNEITQATKDPHWTVYRVWNIDKIPSYENIGNIVQDKNSVWELNTASWHVKRLVNENEELNLRCK